MPPYIYIYLRHYNNSVVENAALKMGNILREWFGSRVLGPDKPSVARVKTLHIRKIVLKLETNIDLRKVKSYLKEAGKLTLKTYKTVNIYFDVDPQ